MGSSARRVMKFISLLCIGFLLFIGCNSPSSDAPPDVINLSDLDDPAVQNKIFNAAINETDLQFQRNPSGEKVFHAANEEQPYTGWVKNIRKLQQFQNGKKHGIYISWYGNWQEGEEGHYKNGLRDGVWIQWSPIGEKESQGSYKDGKRDGLWTLWDPNGEKDSEITYEDGRVLKSIRKSHTDSDKSGFDEHAGNTVPFAFVFRNSTQDKGQLGLPEDAKLRIGKGKINEIKYSPDGTRIAVATSIGIWLYDVHSGKELAVPGETGAVRKIAFSPDGKTLATIGNDSAPPMLSIYGMQSLDDKRGNL